MNRQDLQNIAEAYSQVHEKKDSSYLETDMKKRQKNNEKARKDMEKMGTKMKNPHFEEVSVKSLEKSNEADEAAMKKFQALQKNVDQKLKKNIRGNDSAKQKKRLEKKRGMKLDDHPQFKKEELEASGKFTAEEIEAILNVEGTVTNKLRADAGPPKTTVKMSASGQEPAGDKLLRNIGNSFGNMMNRLNPKAMQSKPAGPQRKPLISTPKEEVQHYEDEFKNAIYEAYEEDIKEFTMGEIGKALSGAGAQVADITANHPVATAAAAGGALGALTGGKKKVKKGLGTAAGAALGAAVGGVPGAVVGGLAGNVVS